MKKDGLLVPVDEGRRRAKEKGGVREQLKSAEKQRLSDDRCRHRQVHRVPDVSIEPADDESLRGRDRRGCSSTLGNEPGEGSNQYRRPDDYQHESYKTDHGVQGWLATAPARKEPGDDAGGSAGDEDEEDRRSYCGRVPSHLRNRRRGGDAVRWPLSGQVFLGPAGDLFQSRQ